MRPALLLFITALLLSSCKVQNNETFFDGLEIMQFTYNDSIKNANLKPGDFETFWYSNLKRVHDRRRALLEKHKINLSVKHGYVYCVDKIGGGYSGAGVYGNIWSSEFDISYRGSLAGSKGYELVTRSVDDEYWNLIREFVEGWDMTRIDSLYTSAGMPSGYIASRTKFENGIAVSIDTYTWSR